MFMQGKHPKVCGKEYPFLNGEQTFNKNKQGKGDLRWGGGVRDELVHMSGKVQTEF